MADSTIEVKNGPFRCPSCGAEIESLSASIDAITGRGQLSGYCKLGHKFSSDLSVPVSAKREPDIVTMRTKVSGVTFNNQDGTCRQALLRRVMPDDQLTMETTTFNGKLSKTCVLRHAIGIIGTLSGDVLAEFREKTAPDAEIHVRVLQITGGTQEKQTLGCNIELSAIKKEESVPSETKKETVDVGQQVFLDMVHNAVFHTDPHCSGLKNATQVSLGYAKFRLHSRPCKRCCSQLENNK